MQRPRSSLRLRGEINNFLRSIVRLPLLPCAHLRQTFAYYRFVALSILRRKLTAAAFFRAQFSRGTRFAPTTRVCVCVCVPLSLIRSVASHSRAFAHTSCEGQGWPALVAAFAGRLIFGTEGFRDEWRLTRGYIWNRRNSTFWYLIAEERHTYARRRRRWRMRINFEQGK